MPFKVALEAYAMAQSELDVTEEKPFDEKPIPPPDFDEIPQDEKSFAHCPNIEEKMRFNGENDTMQHRIDSLETKVLRK